MRWFLHRVHPLLLAKLHARLGNVSAALALSQLTIVGWGWKEHARRGAHCTTDSSVRGRGSRCAGAQRLILTLTLTPTLTLTLTLTVTLTLTTATAAAASKASGAAGSSGPAVASTAAASASASPCSSYG